MGKNKLTLCMIVKNEEDNLQACLQSVENIVDQIIIVDTGSTDNTKGICQKYNAEVFDFKWNKNFAEARNESIKYAKGEWILWLDADEKLNPDSLASLKNIISKTPEKPEIYKVNIKNFQRGDDYFYISDAHRLFTNFKGIKFTGRIHEQVSHGLKKLGGWEYNSDIEILHYGYSLDEEQELQKNLRNQELLQQMITEKPDYAYGYYTLGQNYAQLKKNEEAVKYFKKSLKLNQLSTEITAALYVTLGEVLINLKQYDESEKFLKKSLQLADNQVGAYYLLYKVSELKEDYNKASKYLEKLYYQNQNVKKNGKSISIPCPA